MENSKDNAYYIDKVIEHIDVILGYVGDKDFDSFMADTILVDAVMFRMVQLIENLSRLSHDFVDGHPEIKWRLIKGFRNGIVHDYGKTDYTLVYEIITTDLKELKKQLG